jgi:hypothetical protein
MGFAGSQTRVSSKARHPSQSHVNGGEVPLERFCAPVKPALDVPSRFRGVVWDRRKQLWAARTENLTSGEYRHLGHFENDEDAARKHDLFAARNGFTASDLNFPAEQAALVAAVQAGQNISP